MSLPPPICFWALVLLILSLLQTATAVRAEPLRIDVDAAFELTAPSDPLARRSEDHPLPSTPHRAPGAVDEAPDAEPSLTTDESGWIAVPIIMYSPETHLGAGGVVVHFFNLDKDDEVAEQRLSNIALVALATTRRQLILELIPDLYLERGDWRFWNKLEFQRFPDSFWGVGPRTAAADEERYLRTRFRWRGDARRRILGQFFGGLRLDFETIEFDFQDPEGLFARTQVPGERGGVAAGLGPLLTYDSRDLTTATRHGSLVDVALLGFRGRYDFFKWMLDARHFVPVGDTQTLALRFYAEFNQGDVPFFQMSQLGGDDHLRGYFLGRFRDKNMVIVGTEYRFPIYWRFGGVAFGGAGQVADRVLELPATPVHWAVGGGLRFALSEEQRLNLRVDAGIGPGTAALYLSASEAF